MIANRSATSTLRGETPFQFLNRTCLGKNDVPDLSHLRVLGCRTYVQIPVERRVISRKLDDRAEIGMLVGYEGQHIFRVYIPSRRKVIRSSNVRFDEKCSVNIPQPQDDHWESSAHPHSDLTFPIDGSREENQGTSNNSQSQETQPSSESLEMTPFEKLVYEKHQTLDDEVGLSGDEVTREVIEIEEVGEVEDVEESRNYQEAEETGNDQETEEIGGNQEAEEIRRLSQAQRPRGRPPGSKNRPKVAIEPSTRALRSNRNRNVNEDVAFAAFIAATNSSEIGRNEDDPKTMVEALSGKYKMQWKEGFRREYDSIGSNKTWVVIPRSEVPPGKKVLSGKIVLKTKRDKNGDILKYKVRWVIRGFEQRVGRDFTQTYAGVCRNTSWKVALSIAAMFDLEIEQLDAVTAFLNSTADRDDIYAELPPNWREPSMTPDGDYVCRLLKALYGLKQSPRLWQKHLRKCLEELGFSSLESDNCVFIHSEDRLIVVSYVDDFLLLGKSKEKIAKMKIRLAKKFQLEDLGPAQYFLGVRITRDREKGRLWLTQDAYCRQILGRFGMENCRPAETPMAPGYETFLVPNPGQATAA
ncbi:hypothetical protein K3495_g15060, partial [Podosphaera aphanis]